MIKSLRGSNGSFAKLGNPQVQPVTDDDQYDIDVATNPVSGQALPATQAPLRMRTHVLDSSGMNEASETTIEGFAKSASNESTVIPLFASKFGTVRTSYPSAGKTISASGQDSFSTVQTKKFEPYEKLMGVSSERPEIVMVMDYRPLFENDIGRRANSNTQMVQNSGMRANLTATGMLADMNSQMKSLAHDNSSKLIKGLGKQFGDVDDEVRARKIKFKQSLEALRSTSTFLVSLVRKAERLKQQLDLRDESHIVPAHDMAQQHIASQFQAASSSESQKLLDQAKRLLPNRFDISDIFVRLGYTSDNVGTYASTKLWLQLLAELKTVLQTHSLEFIDVDPTKQRNDKSALVITQDKQKRFSLMPSASSNLPTLDILWGLQASQIAEQVSAVSTAYRQLYENVNFKNENARIAALIHSVSKEIRYSRGLANENVQRTLQQNYSYTRATQPDNRGLFDTIIGRFGDNVTNVPTLSLNSLSSLAFEQESANVAIMTFESRYIEASVGTLSPGGVYYVDDALLPVQGTFNTTKLDNLTDKFESSARALKAIDGGMKLTIASSRDNESAVDQTASDTLSLSERMLYTFVDKQTGSTLPIVRDDRLSALYSYASEDVTLKSMLFLYIVCRATKSSGDLYISSNTAATDQLIAKITARLRAITGTARSIVQQVDNRHVPSAASSSDTLSTDALTHDSISSALKTGTPLTSAIEILFGLFSRAGEGTVINNRTRYSGHTDSAVMMAAFDAIISMIARISNQKIVGQQSGRIASQTNVVTYAVLKTVVNHLETVRDITGRIEKEIALTQQMIYYVTHTLQQLVGSMTSFSNFLKSVSTITTLREISKVITEPNMLRMLMTEQQTLLMASIVDDLYARATSDGSPTNGDIDKNGQFNSDDELKLLDDSVVTPRLKEAMYAIFGTSEYAQKKDINKKIMTVGIPQGFASKIKQRVNASKLKRTSFNDKQSDIISVVVYRVDMRHGDVVYKPQKFLFELSRFAVRNDEKFLDLGDDPTLLDVISSVPTRDMMSGSDNDISYFAQEGGSRLNQSKPALSEPSYEFLSEQQKAQIIRNHVMSYMIEVYVQLLTGMSVSEHHFDMNPVPKMIGEDFIQNLVKASTQQISDSVLSNNSTKSGILFSPSALDDDRKLPDASNVIRLDKKGRKSTSVDSTISVVGSKKATASLHNIRTVSLLAGSVTPLSDPLRISKRLLMPKKFDRIFNIIVDPDDFEIDYDKTVRTKHGQKALERLINSGDVQTITGDGVKTSAGRFAASLNSSNGSRPSLVQGRNRSSTTFKFRDRDKTAGDLSFDKYFVSIETMDEENA